MFLLTPQLSSLSSLLANIRFVVICIGEYQQPQRLALIGKLELKVLCNPVG